jgi:hypothetical protein
MRKFRTRGLAIASALAVLVVGVAVAHENKIPSTVTGNARPGPGPREVTFSGKVNSPNEKCVKGRTVELFDFRTVASKIAETKADADGNWKIVAPTARLRGTQYVQIRKKRLVKNERHRHTCKRDTKQIN